MRRTKLPKDKSTGPSVIRKLKMDAQGMIGDLYSEVRAQMVDAFQAYMKSPEWHMLRIRVISRDNRKCVQCGIPYQSKKGFSVHHKSYRHWGKGNNEEMMDVELLCRKCHNHIDHSFVPFWAKRNPEIDYVSDERMRAGFSDDKGLYD